MNTPEISKNIATIEVKQGTKTALFTITAGSDGSMDITIDFNPEIRPDEKDLRGWLAVQIMEKLARGS